MQNLVIRLEVFHAGNLTELKVSRTVSNRAHAVNQKRQKFFFVEMLLYFVENWISIKHVKWTLVDDMTT